ncbi:MAG: hypothetical protein BYD32DRAFT_54817 [Podila humilis]|nr:MAG: hypothetical protein BYD32DRAFT_54817 [Podila humilis]
MKNSKSRMRQHKEQHNSKFRPNRRAVPFDCVTQAIPSHPIFALSFFFFLLFRQSFMMTSLFHILCSTLWLAPSIVYSAGDEGAY